MTKKKNNANTYLLNVECEDRDRAVVMIEK